MSDYEDEADDWMFQSIKLYNDLHMYELQHPTQTIEWTSPISLAVACHLSDGMSEILQLAVPSALCQSGKNGLVIKASDFKVLGGGLHPKTITSLKHVPNSRILLAAEREENCVTLWNLPDKTDESGLITNCGCVRHPSPSLNSSAVIDATEIRMAYGSHASNISVVDISTRQTVFSVSDSRRPVCSDTDQRISELMFLDEVTLLSCERYTGRIGIIDTRTNSEAELRTRPNPSLDDAASRWACDVARSTEYQSHGRVLVHTLCSKGLVSLCDIRQMNTYIELMQLDRTSSSFGFENVEYMTIKCGAGDSFSVSGGTDGNVCIYKSNSISAENYRVKGTQSPTFTHTGHRAAPVNVDDDRADVTVLTHCWHPDLQNALLSCASDGSLHAWQLKL